MTEIKLFYDWLETHELPPASVALWHGLMQIANRAGWPLRLCISMNMLMARTHIPRPSLYRERKRLQQAGLIDFIARGSRLSSVYVLHSFASRVVSHREMQTSASGSFVSHDETQNAMYAGSDSQFASHGETQTGNIYKLNYTSGKEIEEMMHEERVEVDSFNPIERKGKRRRLNGLAAEAVSGPMNASRQKEKSCGTKERTDAETMKMGKRRLEPVSFSDTKRWLANVEEPWRASMCLWLDYKCSRRERYKSEMSVRKCLSQLKRFADDDPHLARQIIDRSIANNWAGLFPLRVVQQPSQRIGQVIHPANDERLKSLLEKFDRKDKEGQ